MLCNSVPIIIFCFLGTKTCLFYVIHQKNNNNSNNNKDLSHNSNPEIHFGQYNLHKVQRNFQIIQFQNLSVVTKFETAVDCLQWEWKFIHTHVSYIYHITNSRTEFLAKTTKKIEILACSLLLLTTLKLQRGLIHMYIN